MSEDENENKAAPEEPKSNVIPFRSRKQLQQDDDRSSMEMTLRDMLDLVEKGELESVACVAVHKKGGVMSNFSNSPQIELLIAAATTLQHKLCGVREMELMSRPPQSS